MSSDVNGGEVLSYVKLNSICGQIVEWPATKHISCVRILLIPLSSDERS